MESPMALMLNTDAVSWTETDTDEVLALDLRSSTYLKLNGTGAVLWAMLAEGSDEGAMVARLTASFPGDRDQMAGDVASFVRQLRERGLLSESA